MSKVNGPLVLGVITARAGSKGIPGKNIKELGGKPLIAHSILAARQSNLITDLIVSTDGEEIAAVARAYGAEVPFLRPKELAADTTPHLPVMQHATSFMEDRNGVRYDYIVILQPTSPFRRGEDIDGTVQKALDTGADSALSICEVGHAHHPYEQKRLEGDWLRPLCEHFVKPEGMRRQEFPRFYRRNSAVYVTKRGVLMERGSLYGETTTGYLMPLEYSLDIDTPLDFVWAEAIMSYVEKKPL